MIPLIKNWEELRKEKYERILGWIEGKDIKPFTVEYNVTGMCNLNCKSCKALDAPDYGKGENEISRSRAMDMVVEASDIGVKKFQISGSGEPLMREWTVDLMKKIKEKGMVGDIITNGTLLSREDIETLVDIRWDSIKISFDAPDARSNDFLRGKDGTFQKIIDTIDTIQTLKEKRGRDYPQISVNTVWTSLNNDKLPEMVEMCNDLDVTSFILQPMRIEKATETANKLKVESDTEYLQRARKLVEKYDMESNIFFMESDHANKNSGDIIEENESKEIMENIKCFSPLTDMKIMKDGNAGPCMGGSSDLNIKNKKLEEIWSSSEFKDIRKKVTYPDLEGPKFCENCCGVKVIDNDKMKRLLSERKVKDTLENPRWKVTS